MHQAGHVVGGIGYLGPMPKLSVLQAALQLLVLCGQLHIRVAQL